MSAIASRMLALPLTHGGGRQRLQFPDDAWNDFERAIDVRLVVEPAEGETQTAAGLLVNQTHRAQDVRRLKRPGATGRSGRATNIFLVEHHERRVRFDVVEHDAGGIWQTRRTGSIYARAWNFFDERFFKTVPQSSHSRLLLRQFRQCDLRGLSKTDDRSGVLGPGAAIVFVTPAQY